jgi:hypothetical protein
VINTNFVTLETRKDFDTWKTYIDYMMEYLYQRKLAFENMKEEAAATGTVKYGSYNDESRIVR